MRKRGYKNVLGPGQVNYTRNISHDRAAGDIIDQLFIVHDYEHRDILDIIIDKVLNREPTAPEAQQVTAHYYEKSKVRDRRNKLDELIDNILGIPGPHDPTPEQKDDINLLQGNDETFKRL